jgi:hypothetical protein
MVRVTVRNLKQGDTRELDKIDIVVSFAQEFARATVPAVPVKLVRGARQNV